MFAFVLLDLVLQYQAEGLAGKNVFQMTYFCIKWDVKLSKSR